MQFSVWLENEEIQSEIAPFVQRIKLITLESMKVDDGNLEFNFPKDYSSLLAPHPMTVAKPNPQTAQQPYQLAAHYLPAGELIEGWEKEGGKGNVAFKAIQPALANYKWSPGQTKAFKQTLGLAGSGPSKLDRIGKEMGLLFELEVFAHLIDDFKLKAIGYTRVQATNDYEQYRAIIEQNIGAETTRSLIDFIKVHARDLSRQMIQKAKELLPFCNGKITQIAFKGGNHADFKLRTSTADIVIGCKVDRMGFSTKFSSESQMNVVSLSPKQAYIMIARKNPPGDFLEKISTLYSPKDMSAYMIEVMNDLLQSYVGNPKKFTNLLNHVLVGKGNEYINLPAARFYTRGKGGAGFSAALKRDFYIDEMQIDKPLRAKPDADVFIAAANKTYVKIVYKREKNKTDPGTWTGTYLIFEPSDQKINVKMNNLAATGDSR